MTYPPDVEQRLEAALEHVANTLADGFQPTADIAVLVREAVEIADTFDDLDGVAGVEKKALALAFLERAITEHWDAAQAAIKAKVVELDLPGPEFVERLVWDPILGDVAPQIIKPHLLEALPGLVDLVVDATSGRVNVNRKKETDDQPEA